MFTTSSAVESHQAPVGLLVADRRFWDPQGAVATREDALLYPAPQTRYAVVGDSEVAYTLTGDGPVDLLFFFGLGGHLELFWDAPHAPPFLRRLAAFSRLILFNRRGSGADRKSVV